MKAEDLKTKTMDELHKMLLDTRKDQMNLRFQRSGGQLEKTSEIRKMRRDVARIKTFISAKRAQETGAAKPVKAKVAKAESKNSGPAAKAKKPAKKTAA
ncbi:MAG: 50S ribosomal protein L29 [Alphaproteobacteria bacterium]|nr:50S ribosomal protein L29 [Alphaproteobacteria bacterium]